MSSAVRKSHSLAQEHLEETQSEQRKHLGQFFTPPEIAEYMASLVCPPDTAGSIRVLDPGAGTGILGIAAARALLARFPLKTVSITAFEVDSRVLGRLHSALAEAEVETNGRLTSTVLERDFLESTEGSLFRESTGPFDVVIANPPYFKTSPSAAGGVEPNAYASFLRRSADLLRMGGQLVFIVPRSFASGFYFRRFRQFLREKLRLEHLHVFESRSSAFKDQSVLQENVIIAYRKDQQDGHRVTISSSSGATDLRDSHVIEVPASTMFSRGGPDSMLRMPTTVEDLELLNRFDSLPNRLRDFGLAISTGPVVPFRATGVLRRDDTSDGKAAPLLWLQHVTADGVRWPIDGFKKPQAISVSAPDKLRVPNQTCILLRRFSAKEDARRLIAGVLREGQLPGAWVGIENHLNFIYRPNGRLEVELAEGLARILNSQQYDDYFRICNGNTQVGATEIRELPLPPATTILSAGRSSAKITTTTKKRSDFTSA